MSEFIAQKGLFYEIFYNFAACKTDKLRRRRDRSIFVIYN